MSVKTRVLSSLPPRAAMRVAGIVVAIVLGCASVGFVVDGVDLAVSCAVGSVAVLALALRGPSWPSVVWFVVVLAAASALASQELAAVAAGLVVAVAVIVQLPVVRRYGAVVGVVPVIVANIAGGTLESEPIFAAMGTVMGAVLTIAAVRVLRIPRVPAPDVGRRVAWAYVLMLGLTAGAVTAVVVHEDLPHGMWLVIALSTVLVPMPHETVARGRVRVAGTIVGALVGSAVAALVPAWIAIAVGLVAVFVSVAMMVAHRRHAFVAYGALAVVVLVGAGHGDVAVDAAAVRVGWTLAGALVAAGAGWVISTIERR